MIALLITFALLYGLVALLCFPAAARLAWRKEEKLGTPDSYRRGARIALRAYAIAALWPLWLGHYISIRFIEKSEGENDG